jgi:hypothetical protein
VIKYWEKSSILVDGIREAGELFEERQTIHENELTVDESHGQDKGVR